jgi:hypothetical protein
MDLKNIKIHTLSNDAKVIMVSPGHGFKFSDGTQCDPQDAELCSKLTLKRELKEVKRVKGMALNETKMILSQDQINFLKELSKLVDLVIIPFPVLSAIREQNIRDEFPNCVAFNATQETMRLAPDEKVVDINNWSY